MIDRQLASHGTQIPFTLATHKWAPADKGKDALDAPTSCKHYSL